MTEQFITVGEIVNTQGVHGEVRVIPATDFPERFSKSKKILVLQRGQRQEYAIEKAWEHKKFIILKFAGISDMTTAEKLKGGLLQITPEELTPLPKGSYYQFQIIGLKVIDENGLELGTISNILRTGANDVYEVKRPEGKDILIPALKSIIKKIDLSSGKMEVELPEGLL